MTATVFTPADSIDGLNKQLDGFEKFMLRCPENMAHLKDGYAKNAEEINLAAWTLARTDMTLIDAADLIRIRVEKLCPRTETPASTRAHKGKPLTLDQIRTKLTGLAWDGRDRLNDSTYLQRLFGSDVAIDAKFGVSDFYLGAAKRLFVPGSKNLPLSLGGKRAVTEPLAEILAGVFEPAFMIEPRNLRPDRATFLTLLDGQGKEDEILTRTKDTFTRPHTKLGPVTEDRWFSFIAFASNSPRPIDGRPFIPMSGKPDLDLAKTDAAQLLAQAYAEYYEEMSTAPVVTPKK